MDPTAGRDFFISYTGVNRPWAEWIAVQLEAAGYSTVLQAFDFEPGTDFVHQMHLATDNAERTIAVLSPAYIASAFSEAEWRAAFAKDPSGELGLLIPVRVQPGELRGLLTTRVYVDLVDADEPTCRRRLLDAVKKSRVRPTSAPFPGMGGRASLSARFPGAGLAVSNLPPRNRNVSGRADLRDRMNADLQVSDSDRSPADPVPDGFGRPSSIHNTTLRSLSIATRARKSLLVVACAGVVIAVVLAIALPRWLMPSNAAPDDPGRQAEPITQPPPGVADNAHPRSIGTDMSTPKWWLTDELSAPTSTRESFPFGITGDVPLVGNWNDDPSDEPSLYRPSDRNFIFSGSESPAPVHVSYSQPGDWPVIGDWDGNGRDDVGLYRPTNATFYLGRGETGEPIIEVTYGTPSSTPLIGDWNGNGRDEIGVYRAGDRTFDRRSENGAPLPPIAFGESGDIPLAGNWDDDPSDEVGVYNMSTRTFVFAADKGTEFANIRYGSSTVKPVPLVGDWNGDLRDTQGVVQ